MGFRTGAYATVWETRERNGFAEARLSINRKDKDGNFVSDWADWVSLYSDAKNLVGVPSKTRIRLGDVDVSNRYDKEKKITYVNYKIFSYENADSNTDGNAGRYNAPARPAVVADDPDAMPF